MLPKMKSELPNYQAFFRRERVYSKLSLEITAKGFLEKFLKKWDQLVLELSQKTKNPGLAGFSGDQILTI